MWKTAGTAYGDHKQVGGAGSDCFEVDESAWLRDPSRTANFHQRLGDDESGPWITVLAVHPSVTAVRLTASAGPARTLLTKAMPSRPGGPRYVVFTTPADQASVDIEWTLLTATGQPVTGGTQRVRLNR